MKLRIKYCILSMTVQHHTPNKDNYCKNLLLLRNIPISGGGKIPCNARPV